MLKDVNKLGLWEVVGALRDAFPQASDKAIDEALRVLREGNRANGGA